MGAVILGLGALLLAGAAPYFAPALFVGFSAYAAGTLWIARRMAFGYPHLELGWCNIITHFRLVIVGILFVALLAGVPPSWTTFGLAAFAISLDGVDGWAARKQGLSSDFGAWFDVEVDAAFALTLALFAALNGEAAAYVVFLGLPYYLFGFARQRFAWLDQPLPEKFNRKAVCVLQIAALIALQFPLLAPHQMDPLIAGVTLALIWSFGRDIAWLWKHKA